MSSDDTRPVEREALIKALNALWRVDKPAARVFADAIGLFRPPCRCANVFDCDPYDGWDAYDDAAAATPTTPAGHVSSFDSPPNEADQLAYLISGIHCFGHVPVPIDDLALVLGIKIAGIRETTEARGRLRAALAAAQQEQT